MSWISSLATVSLWFLPQETVVEKKEADVENIEVRLEKIGMPSYFIDTVALMPPPLGARRNYFWQELNSAGEPIGRPAPINEADFYSRAGKALNYGTLDRPSLDHLTYPEQYQNFIKLLLRHRLIDEGILKQLAQKFINVDTGSRAIESAYFLDEAFPGIVAKEQWQSYLDYYGSPYYYNGYYTWLLARVKASDLSKKSLNDIRSWLDDQTQIPYFYSADFESVAQGYAEVIKKGADFPDVSQIRLFDLYHEFSKNKPEIYTANLKKNYIALNLPLPSKEIMLAVLLPALQSEDKLNPNHELVYIFRMLELNIPKQLAADCRDLLLQFSNNLKDIEYVIKIAGEDAEPELWKKYADWSLRCYEFKERRIEEKDQNDYYHCAVEGYKRVYTYINKHSEAAANNEDKEFIKRLNNLKLNDYALKALLAALDDPSARMSDLLVIYELADRNPKHPLFLEKFKKRIEFYEQQLSGAYYHDNGEVKWRVDEYGRHILPFRDAIELAAYLKDQDLFRSLSMRIATYLSEKLQEEGEFLKKIYKDHPEHLVEKLGSCDGPTYSDLEEIYELYKELGFKDGAASLAFHLDEAGFILMAQRFFQLSDLGPEVEESYFGKHDKNYWQDLQKRNNIAARTFSFSQSPRN